MIVKQVEYFIRHTNKVEISETDFKKLFFEASFGIHFTSNCESLDEYLDESKYPQIEGKTAIRYLKELAEYGGFIWCEYAYCNEILVGYVSPGSKIFLREFEPIRNTEDFKNTKGRLFLKCLNLEKQKIIGKNELLALRARRPRQGTFVHWPKSYGLIEKIMEHGLKLPLESWEDLTPDIQEVVTYEYLREVGINGIKIDRLLMPIGRTMKDVDIFALSTSNRSILVQVTNFSLSQSGTKIKSLQDYNKQDIDLIFVYTGPSTIPQDDMHFVNSELIWRWLVSKPEYLNRLYS